MLSLQCAVGSTPADVLFARHRLPLDVPRARRSSPRAYPLSALTVARAPSDAVGFSRNTFPLYYLTRIGLAGWSPARDVSSMAKKGKKRVNGGESGEDGLVFGIVEDSSVGTAASPSVDQTGVERALGTVPLSDLAVAARVDAALWAREEARWQREAARWEREERRWEREREAFERDRDLWAKTKADLLAELEGLKKQVGSISRESVTAASLPATSAPRATASPAAAPSPVTAPLPVTPAPPPPAPPPTAKEVKAPVPAPANEAAKAPPPPAGTPNMPRLKSGASGDMVEVLHKMLENQGFYPGEEEIEYGMFLDGTESAVKTFQCTHKLKEDGIVGAKTWSVLLALEGSPAGLASTEAPVTATAPPAASTPPPSLPPAATPSDSSSSWGGSKISATPESERYARTETQASSGSGGVRVFLLGENRWEEPGRTSPGPISREAKAGDKGSKGLKPIGACFTCRGVGAMMCTECEGTGQMPGEEDLLNFFAEEEAGCMYCDGTGLAKCDECNGTGNVAE